RRGRLRHGARARRPQLPLRPPLPRAPPAEPTDAAPDRSAHPPAHPLSRAHRSPRRQGGPRMTLAELDRALRQLRLSGMADALEARLRQAQADRMAPLDLVAALVTDELVRRQDRLLARRRTQARFRDPGKTLDTFDFDFNKKVDRALVFTLATGRFIAAHDDALFLGPPGTGKSHLAQAIGQAAMQPGYRLRYTEAHGLLDELADATLDGTRREKMTELATVPLL